MFFAAKTCTVQSLIAVVLTLLFSFNAIKRTTSFKDCDLVLNKHGTIHGIGVYANRNFNRGEVVERCIAVTIPSDRNSPILDEYIYGHRDEFIDILLGYGMIYNHHSNETLHVHSTESLSIRTEQSNMVFDFVLTALYDIKKGDEIFSSYGAAWFDQRGISYVSVENTWQSSNHQERRSALPGCSLSMTEVFRGHVYATQYILAGAIVEVARALLLPISTGDDNDLQKYLWYSNGGFNKSLLALGHGALYQASDTANLSYEWYVDEDDDAELACDDKMFVKFTATKLIVPNMELTVPLFTDGLRRYVKEDSLQLKCF